MARTLGNEAIGSTVKLSFNGGLREFIVIHHGKPSGDYGAGFDGGTILLMKDIYSMTRWSSGQFVLFTKSYPYNALGGIAALFGNEIKKDLRTVTIPYQNSISPSGLRTGSGGLATQLFILSAKEIGYIPDPDRGWDVSSDGDPLSYFSSGKSKVAYYNGAATDWWLRSTNVAYEKDHADPNPPPWPCCIRKDGVYGFVGDGDQSASLGIRPALVLPDTLYISDGNQEVTKNLPPTTPASIAVPASIKGGGTAEITWGASTDPDGNLSGYRLERSVNSGAFSQIYQGSALKYTDSITYGWNTVAYRVRAYDSAGAASDYRTGPTRTIFNNSAPTAPPSLLVPDEIKGGKAFSISWGASTDVDGNLAGYQLERSLNGAAYVQVFKGAARSYTDTVAKGTKTAAYRVRAYDSENAWSGYTTSAMRTVINNTPPSISGADSSLGAKNAPFSVAYSVSDPDGDVITVVEKADGKVLRTFTAAANREHQIALDAATFQQILNGAHKLTVTATDAPGESVTRTWSWTKNVTHIAVTMKTPKDSGGRPYKCLLNINAAIPKGALVVAEVCNNGYDAKPAWEECTSLARSGQPIFFSNKNKTAAKWGFNFRMRVERSGAAGDCYVTGISGNFEEESGL